MSSSISQRAARLQAQLRAAQAEKGTAGRATSSSPNKQVGRPEKASSSWQWMGKSVRRYVGLGALVVSLLVIVVMATRTYRQLQAERIGRQLATVDDSAVPGLVAQLSLLDDPGVRVLVQNLGHERQLVVDQSQLKLSSLVDSWRAMPVRDSSRHVAVLAESLAASADLWPAEQQQFARNLATELLLWPLDESRVNSAQVVMHCELVLRVAPNRPLVESIANDDSSRPAAEPRQPILNQSPVPGPGVSVPAKQAASRLGVDLENFPWESTEMPGGGLPVQPLEVPSLPPLPADEPLDAPSRFIPDTTAQGLPEKPESTPSLFGGTPAMPVVDPQVKPPEEIAHLPLNPEWTKLSHIDVLRRLHVSEYEVKSRALAELRRRGFTQELLDIGHQATSPNATDRLELAMSLQRRRDLDPLPWLRHLSNDVNQDVSREALLGLSVIADPFEAKLAKERLREQSESIGTRPDPTGPRIE